MKDYFDLTQLATHDRFDGIVLQAAIRAAFAARGTLVPTTVPEGLEQAFSRLPQTQSQWNSFMRNQRQSGHPGRDDGRHLQTKSRSDAEESQILIDVSEDL